MQNSPTKEPFTFYKADSYILNHFGVEPAGVHAVIRNKSQTPGYVCELSEQTIGNLLHMSYKRVKKAINVLLENGFIKRVKGNTNLMTNAYQCVLERCDIPLTNENTISLKCNDNRVRKHEENKRAYEAKKHSSPDDTNRTNNKDETNHIKEEKFDDTNPPNKQSVNDTNCPPIKNCIKELKDKEINVVSSSFFTEEENNVRVYLEKKLGYKYIEQDKWKAIFRYISERQENNQLASDLVEYLKYTDFNMGYMTLARLKEIYLNEMPVHKKKEMWDTVPGWQKGWTMADYVKSREEREKTTMTYPEWQKLCAQRALEEEAKLKEAEAKDEVSKELAR